MNTPPHLVGAETPNVNSQSRFLQLPADFILQVIRYHLYKADAVLLSLTCRALRDLWFVDNNYPR